MPGLPCIYCLRLTGPFTSEAHAFPEAIIKNTLALPPGVVCDPCNSYFGANVEPALIGHPFVAMAIQLLGLPGKKGRPRQKLANVERDPQAGWITVPIQAPDRSSMKGMKIKPVVDRSFKMPIFSRALHHLAFNILTLQTTQRFALREHFTPVRRFIREPQKGVIRPFVIAPSDMSTVRLELAAGREPKGPGETIGIRLFNYDIFLDLLDRGALLHWAQENLDSRFYFIDDSWEPTPPEPSERLYRIRIEPPDGYLS